MEHHICCFCTFISKYLLFFNCIHRIYRILQPVIYHLIFKSSYLHYVTDLKINWKNISSNWQPHLMVVLTTKYLKFYLRWSIALHASIIFAVYLLLALWQQGSHIYQQGSLFPCSRTFVLPLPVGQSQTTHKLFSNARITKII